MAIRFCWVDFGNPAVPKIGLAIYPKTIHQ
jgi:hypothetical protein